MSQQANTIQQNNNSSDSRTPSTSVQPSKGSQWNEGQREYIRNKFVSGGSDQDLAQLIKVASELRLNPMEGEIWAIKFETDGPSSAARLFISHQGFLSLAHNSGLLDGLETVPVYDATDCTKLIGAKSRVWRSDMRQPFTVQVSLSEHKRAFPGSLWLTAPETLVSEVAECMAIRKAFNVRGVFILSELGLDKLEENRLSFDAVPNGVPPVRKQSGVIRPGGKSEITSTPTTAFNTANQPALSVVPELPASQSDEKASAMEANTVRINLPTSGNKTTTARPVPLSKDVELPSNIEAGSVSSDSKPNLPTMQKEPTHLQKTWVEMTAIALKLRPNTRHGDGIEPSQLPEMSYEQLRNELAEITGGWELKRIANEIGYPSIIEALAPHFPVETYKEQGKLYALAVKFVREWWVTSGQAEKSNGNKKAAS